MKSHPASFAQAHTHQFLFVARPSVQATYNRCVSKAKGKNCAIEHTGQRRRASVIRSEHNETTQTFEPAAI